MDKYTDVFGKDFLMFLFLLILLALIIYRIFI